MKKFSVKKTIEGIISTDPPITPPPFILRHRARRYPTVPISYRGIFMFSKLKDRPKGTQFGSDETVE